jgi:hypothetical protein
MSITTSAITSSTANTYVSASSTAITWLSLTNYDSGNVLANVFVVPSGSSANTQNIILANILITGGDTYQLYQAGEKLLLDVGDTVQANCSSNLAAVVSYTTI